MLPTRAELLDLSEQVQQKTKKKKQTNHIFAQVRARDWSQISGLN